MIPIVDYVSHHVDQRVCARLFRAETALTRDTVPVDADAIYFYFVWDVEKAVLEVENYADAILFTRPHWSDRCLYTLGQVMIATGQWVQQHAHRLSRGENQVTMPRSRQAVASLS